jgi:LacI family transcriptional regulator
MAAAAVSVAHRRGLDLPKDLTVVGFDDTTAATTLWPALTTVRQPLKTISAIAIDILLREIRARKEGQSPEPVDHVVRHTIIERQSSAAPPEV